MLTSQKQRTSMVAMVTTMVAMATVALSLAAMAHAAAPMFVRSNLTAADNFTTLLDVSHVTDQLTCSLKCAQTPLCAGFQEDTAAGCSLVKKNPEESFEESAKIFFHVLETAQSL